MIGTGARMCPNPILLQDVSLSDALVHLFAHSGEEDAEILATKIFAFGQPGLE